jgi:DNA (cytosine-5)-methyltransferase 1
MRHGSLFSGIGGFDLAAEWMGWENVFQVEIDKYCQKVLEKNFPNVKRYGDIKEFDGTKYRGLVDIISGGFPCQPYSVAGKRKGEADDRHLWPEMLRTIREIQPYWVVAENVPGIINWSRGLVFNKVQTDLETEGYEVFPVLLPVVGRGGVHRRRRVWFIVHRIEEFKPWENCKNGITPYSAGNAVTKQNRKGFKIKETGQTTYESMRRRQFPTIQYIGLDDISRDVTNTNIYGLQRDTSESQTQRDVNGFFETVNRGNYPSESPICRTTDGIPNRVDRIKGLGNAIVPQIAYQIFKAIEGIR